MVSQIRTWNLLTKLNLKLSLNLNNLITTPPALKRNGSKVSWKWKNIHITLMGMGSLSASFFFLEKNFKHSNPFKRRIPIYISIKYRSTHFIYVFLLCTTFYICVFTLYYILYLCFYFVLLLYFILIYIEIRLLNGFERLSIKYVSTHFISVFLLCTTFYICVFTLYYFLYRWFLLCTTFYICVFTLYYLYILYLYI